MKGFRADMYERPGGAMLRPLATQVVATGEANLHTAWQQVEVLHYLRYDAKHRGHERERQGDEHQRPSAEGAVSRHSNTGTALQMPAVGERPCAQQQ